MIVNAVGTITNETTGEVSEVRIQTESDLAVRVYVDGDWNGFEYATAQSAKDEMHLEMLAYYPELTVAWDEHIR